MTKSPIYIRPSFCIDNIFFFQAEDGIRDWSVTGVQTCALPIYSYPSPTGFAHASQTRPASELPRISGDPSLSQALFNSFRSATLFRSIYSRRVVTRSEERRVGKSVDLGGRRIIKKKKKK